MGRLKVNLVGATAIIDGFRSALATEEEAAQHIVETSGAILLFAIHSAASGPLKPSDLIERGHPYARRHGSITGGAPVLDGVHMVNKQTGALRKAIEGRMRRGRAPAFDISVNLGDAPHAKYVMLGTATMLARPIVAQVASSAQLQARMKKNAIRVIRKVFKSNAKISFK